MSQFAKYMLILAFTFSFTAALMAESHSNHHQQISVLVKGSGTFVNPNPISNGFNANISKFNIKARGTHLITGSYKVSSSKAAPIDPITGVDFEVKKSCIDGVRVFASHPDIVWVHGFIQKGFIIFGLAVIPPVGVLPGEKVELNVTNGEFIGAVTTWGRTNFLTVLENNNQPFTINFFTATEEELTALVGGFSRLLLTNGAKPGKITIHTTGQDITIRKRGGCQLLD